MFYIQVSNPRVINCEKQVCNDLFDAAELLFPLFTEKAFMVWNGIWLPIDYKYDLCVILEDILYFLNLIMNDEAGFVKVCFGSDTFQADWNIRWKEDLLEIQSVWNSIHGGKEILVALNNSPNITMSKNQFISEWKGLLSKIVHAIRESGLKFIDQQSYMLLQDLEKKIPQEGCLYNPHFEII